MSIVKNSNYPSFSESERKLLLKAHQVGSKVIERLEQVGLGSFKKLAKSDWEEVLVKISFFTNDSTWKSHKMAKVAIQNAIETAKTNLA